MQSRPVSKREKRLSVTDETLGKATNTRITDRGTYVTYDATGERILYPMGLPSKLLKTAFPEVKKETKKEALILWIYVL